MSGQMGPPPLRRSSTAQRRNPSIVRKSSAPPSENGAVASNGNHAKPTSPTQSSVVGERTVKKLRLSKALTIPEGTTVSDACRRMAARRVDAVLLTDANALLSGIVTDKDIATRVIAEELRPEQTIISKVMTRNPIFVNSDSLAIEALQKMVQGKFRHLPVVENGEVIAILDITKCLYDAISRMEKAAEQGSAIAAAVEGVERQFGSNFSAPSAFVETLRERMFKPSLSAIISDNSRVAIISPSDTVYVAAKMMRELRVNSVVAMTGNKIQGILTSKDILMRVVAQNLSPELTLVEKVMTQNPECVTLETTILEALHIMHDGKFLHLPVLEKDGGITACMDVLQITQAAISMDLASGKTIGNADLCAGLYLFKMKDSPRKFPPSHDFQPTPSRDFQPTPDPITTNKPLQVYSGRRQLQPESQQDPAQDQPAKRTLSKPDLVEIDQDQVQIPSNITEALRDPNWKVAALDEINALEKNNTWQITDLPPGKRTVGCKWIFTVKHKADGSIERYKARLVAKGYTQAYGIDYQETFAPVARLNTVRALLSLAANLDWPLYQHDVKNAFLNGDLEEEVYMDIPPCFESETTNKKVCRLRKSLYGLKQSPRAWFYRFTNVLKAYEYTQCQSDHTLFVKHSEEGKISVIIVYVDDIVITGNHETEIARVKSLLAKEFEMKDLGHLKYFLGMEVARSSLGISISQRKYVLDLLKETGMLGCKPAETPMDPNVKIGMRNDSPLVDKERYQRLVGKLIYLSHTRPDIGFVVSVVSQFMNNPNEEHMEAVHRVLRYLKKAPGKGLLFKKSSSRNVQVYTDADWAGSPIDRRSTSGYCTFIWGNLVTWRSKKQSVVARSSAEAEFRALSNGICEGIWLQRLLKELQVEGYQKVELMCDNQAAINIAKNPVHHDRTKHVEVDRHFISEKVEKGIVDLRYIPTQLQLADILTKALYRPNFEDMISKLGMINIYNPA